jgi:transcriptional regulator with XRE-family HTH domain
MDGNKVRKLRKEKNMTLDDLSQKSGFTSSYISQVERNLIEPSLSSLSKICEILNVSPYYFIENEKDNIIIQRKEDRQILVMPDENKELSFLVPINDEKKSNIKFGIYETKIKAGKWDSQNFIVIDSDKCVIIKKGTLLISINELNELLLEGDSIYIKSNVPHKLYNPADDDTEIICITSPSIY